MEAYTYGDYVYFKNMTDTPNEHNNNLILNNIPDMYTTSPLNITEEIFVLLPNLIAKKKAKKRINSNIKYFAQL